MNTTFIKRFAYNFTWVIGKALAFVGKWVVYALVFMSSYWALLHHPVITLALIGLALVTIIAAAKTIGDLKRSTQ